MLWLNGFQKSAAAMNMKKHRKNITKNSRERCRLMRRTAAAIFLRHWSMVPWTWWRSIKEQKSLVWILLQRLTMFWSLRWTVMRIFPDREMNILRGKQSHWNFWKTFLLVIHRPCCFEVIFFPMVYFLRDREKLLKKIQERVWMRSVRFWAGRMEEGNGSLQLVSLWSVWVRYKRAIIRHQEPFRRDICMMKIFFTMMRWKLWSILVDRRRLKIMPICRKWMWMPWIRQSFRNFWAMVFRKRQKTL